MAATSNEFSDKGLPTRFQIWGARGSRNTVGSSIANHTSCYSLAVGEHLFVFDAGSGLLPLSAALTTDQRLQAITNVHIFISHAHWDHWEGIKDADWMWRKNNGLALTIHGPKEALDALKACCSPPSFVELHILAMGGLDSLSFVELELFAAISLPGATVDTLRLNHYSGLGDDRCDLHTLGYRLSVDKGPTLLYLCDHEPTDATSEMEDAALSTADLAILDSSYSDISEHAFGHGSMESSAELARKFPKVRVFAAHHGPMQSDRAIKAAAGRHASDIRRFSIATEGTAEDWDPDTARFGTNLESS